MDFVEATDLLMAKLTSDDLAQAFGCSRQTIQQARMAPDSIAHRSPPPNWEDAAVRAAERRAAYFIDLAAKLARHSEKRDPIEKRIAKLKRQLADLRASKND